LRPRSTDTADPAALDALDLERAGARAVVRANAEGDIERQSRAPAAGLPQNTTARMPRT
jgi:hypothetical protein